MINGQALEMQIQSPYAMESRAEYRQEINHDETLVDSTPHRYRNSRLAGNMLDFWVNDTVTPENLHAYLGSYELGDDIKYWKQVHTVGDKEVQHFFRGHRRGANASSGCTITVYMPRCEVLPLFTSLRTRGMLWGRHLSQRTTTPCGPAARSPRAKGANTNSFSPFLLINARPEIVKSTSSPSSSSCSRSCSFSDS